MKTAKLDGLILAQKPLFEKDLLLTVFSREAGKTRILARSAKQNKGAQSGRYELTNWTQFEIFLGKSFKTITQSTIKQAFPMIRTAFDRISMAGHFFDLVLKSTDFDQPHPGLFDALFTALTALNQDQPSIKEIQLGFYHSFLQAEGLLANPDRKVSLPLFQQQFEAYTHHPFMPPLFCTPLKPAASPS